jgi:hypothetical protein
MDLKIMLLKNERALIVNSENLIICHPLSKDAVPLLLIANYKISLIDRIIKRFKARRLISFKANNSPEPNIWAFSNYLLFALWSVFCSISV